MFVAAALVLCLAYGAVAFAPSKAKTTLKTALKMAGTPMFDPKEEAGVAPPFGFFDPLGLCPSDERTFKRWQESEIKHGRIAMLATVGFLVTEKGYTFVPGVTGPAIVHFQQAEGVLPFFTQLLIGFLLIIEAADIARKWENPRETREAGTAIASIKSDSIPGDLGFDPLGLKPKTENDFKTMQTKELNNGRLAMMAIAGFVAQELVTHENIFK